MEFIDTHCHIHSKNYKLDPVATLNAAKQAGVKRIIAVGTDLEDSKQAADFAAKHKNVWASVGIHPHEAKDFANNQPALDEFAELANNPKVIAIGEAGLDYHYLHSPKSDQIKLFKVQIELASKLVLPMIFHVREAFEDFWKVFDEHTKDKPIKGVLHSFSSAKKDLENALKRGLYVGLNGIATFTTSIDQQASFKALPLDKLLLETDAPFLTPTPYRGTICEPKHVVVTAKFLSELRREPLEKIAQITARNATDLFGI